MEQEIEKRYLFSQKIIKEVGNIAIDFYLNRDQLSMEYKKGDKLDLVSVADRTIEEQIKLSLKEYFPNDGFFGEEFGKENIEREFCWVVDPIDGTNSFLYGLHTWCISIAILHKREIVAGVIFDPVHNEMFHASVGKGAFLNNQPIKVLPIQNLQDGLFGVGMSHRVPVNTFTNVLHQILVDGGIFIRNGSAALMLAYIAAGRLIGYFESHINAWDVCAGILIIREAGGITNSFFEDDGLLNGNYILAASSKDIYEKVLNMKNKEIISK